MGPGSEAGLLEAHVRAGVGQRLPVAGFSPCFL